MVNWTDISSYSKNDAERKTKSVQTYIGNVRLVVTRHIHYSANEWVANFGDIYSTTVVSDQDLDHAKFQALSKAKSALQQMISIAEGL